MTIGESGNHEGFETAAEEVYSALKNYLSEYCSEKSIKLWITGYSRAAALSDVLAVKIISNGEVEVSQKDLFVYAFEPPASVSSDTVNNEKYTCIHNIFVESDIVASIPPTIESADYGMCRPGVDLKMDVTVDGLEDSLHKYVGKDVDMPEFTPGDGYTDPSEFLEYFLEGLTSATTDPEAASLESREKFYSTIQSRLSYLAEVLMKNNRAGIGALTEYISEHKDELALIIFRWIGDDGFYNDLAPILDSCGTEYDTAELKTACSIIPSLYKNTDFDIFLLGFVADSSKATNAMYTVSCHYPEVCYALLNAQAF